VSELLQDDFRSGYVVVIGRPNVGKSTLVNRLVGARLAPTSPVPQTTRRRLLGILSRDDVQVVFVDTPGMHRPVQKLGESMVRATEQALVEADLVLCVLDCTRETGDEDRLAMARARQVDAPALLVVNKVDRADGPTWRPPPEAEAFAALHRTSALTGQGLPELLDDIVARLPEGPPYFPLDQLSDAYEREIGGELIREAALGRLRQELPHAVAVRVEEWKQRANGMIYVQATLYVERESQKGIVIGQGGRTLKEIGTIARRSLEGWTEQRVYLDLHVKVLKDWRKDEHALRRLGLL